MKDKQIQLPEGHKISSAKELREKKYWKWHNQWSHTTNNYWVFRNAIQKSIVEGRLKFPDKDKGVMLIGGDSFSKVTINMTSANLVKLMGNHG